MKTRAAAALFECLIKGWKCVALVETSARLPRSGDDNISALQLHNVAVVVSVCVWGVDFCKTAPSWAQNVPCRLRVNGVIWSNPVRFMWGWYKSQVSSNYWIDSWPHSQRNEHGDAMGLLYLQGHPQKQTKQSANLLSSDSKIVMRSTRLKDKKGVIQYSPYCQQIPPKGQNCHGQILLSSFNHAAGAG